MDSTRNRILQVLGEEPSGLSKAELQRRVERNPGAFRRARHRLVEEGLIVVTEEDRDYGRTTVHRISDEQADINQTTIDDFLGDAA